MDGTGSDRLGMGWSGRNGIERSGRKGTERNGAAGGDGSGKDDWTARVGSPLTNIAWSDTSSLTLVCGLISLGSGASLPETAPVAGKLIGPGRIAFYPEAGRAALGTIDDQGQYTLTTFEPGDGAIPGTHRVTITVTNVTVPPPPASFEEDIQRGSGATASGKRRTSSGSCHKNIRSKTPRLCR